MGAGSIPSATAYTLTAPTKLTEAEWILLPGLLRAYYQKEENKLKKKQKTGVVRRAAL